MKNKFVKLVHLVGFIIKKFVTMGGHMDVKQNSTAYYDDWLFASIRFFLKKKGVQKFRSCLYEICWS